MTFRRPRCRAVTPSVLELESRRLLSTLPTAVWLDQDGHDYAGGATPLAGNGVQDIHIALSDLPANDPIETVDVQGDGGGEWVVNIGPFNQYNGALFQTPGATTADLYVDPYQTETGRSFGVVLTYKTGPAADFYFQGGAANPDLRMPTDAAKATWIGQDGQDFTGPYAAVGPDGFQDVHVVLSQLFPGDTVTSVTVTPEFGVGWAYGTNPGALDNAEFFPSSSDLATGDLYFSSPQNLAGQTLTVLLTYASGKTDETTLTAGTVDPTLAMPLQPAPVLTWNTVTLSWIGQDGLNLVGTGDVHLAVDGLPSDRTVVAATLNDASGIDWGFVAPGSGLTAADPDEYPLAIQRTPGSSHADLTMPPYVNESGAALTLVLTLDDGTMLATETTGGASDPGLREPNISSTSVVAYPGDDLNALAAAYGTVRLVAGIYPMDQPLVLSKAVTILADPGVTLLFAQGPTDPTWTAAIKVLASHITLEGFAVRFAGPIRWTDGVNYGPAVVGGPDQFDPWSPDPLIDLTFTDLDLQAPVASTSWEEAPDLFRMHNAESGTITNNRLRGGATSVFGGPWNITGNDFLGTLPNTYTYEAFGGQNTVDVTIANNIVQPVGATGKTWRFLVMTQTGRNDVVANNTVVGVGPMDSDTVPNPNATEIILTESYRIHYEGMITSVSPDGLVVQVPTPQGGPARSGDILAILSGPEAGTWRTIAQALSPTLYMLDAPIAPGSFAVSIVSGFANETYQGNSINSVGSSTANDMVLAGNQFGAKVIGNQFIGGDYAFKLLAYPSESPGIFGWSYVPFLEATIQGNTVRDTLLGSVLDVFQSTASKTTSGRDYFSGSFTNNTGIWSASFLSTRASIPGLPAPALVTIGDASAIDPFDLNLSESGNTIQGLSAGQGGALDVIAGTINGTSMRNQTMVLLAPVPAAPVVAAQTITPAPTGLIARSVTSPAPTTIVGNSVPVGLLKASHATHKTRKPAKPKPKPKVTIHVKVKPKAAISSVAKPHRPAARPKPVHRVVRHAKPKPKPRRT